MELHPVSTSTGGHVNCWVRAWHYFSKHENRAMPPSSDHLSAPHRCSESFLWEAIRDKHLQLAPSRGHSTNSWKFVGFTVELLRFFVRKKRENITRDTFMTWNKDFHPNQPSKSWFEIIYIDADIVTLLYSGMISKSTIISIEKEKIEKYQMYVFKKVNDICMQLSCNWRCKRRGSVTSSPEPVRMGGVPPLLTLYFYKYFCDLVFLVSLPSSFTHTLTPTGLHWLKTWTKTVLVWVNQFSLPQGFDVCVYGNTEPQLRN